MASPKSLTAAQRECLARPTYTGPLYNVARRLVDGRPSEKSKLDHAISIPIVLADAATSINPIRASPTSATAHGTQA